jgi:hypothetical protein
MIRMLLVALSLFGLAVVAQPAAAQPAAVHAAAKAATAVGTVKSVTTEALTLTSNGKDMTFKIDGTTKFVATGLSTKSAKNKIMATDAIGVNDSVRVTYQDLGGGVLRAASVRVTHKSGAKS